MIVYGAILSPYVRKVLAFAAQKGVDVESRAGGMGAGGEEFAEASPMAKMPALRDPGAGKDGKDYLLADSSAICAYIEARHPSPALIPADPCERGEAIWLDEFGDTVLMAVGARIFFNRVVSPLFLRRPGDEAAAETAELRELPRVLDWLEGRVAGREWLVGQSATIADLAVAAPLFNIAAAVTGDPLNTARYPEIGRWLTGVLAGTALGPITAKAAAVLAKARARATE